MRNRFTTRNQWFTETIETIRTSGLTLIISTIRFFKSFTAECGFKIPDFSTFSHHWFTTNQSSVFSPYQFHWNILLIIWSNQVNI